MTGQMNTSRPVKAKLCEGCRERPYTTSVVLDGSDTLLCDGCLAAIWGVLEDEGGV
jgi:hypothetical protein